MGHYFQAQRAQLRDEDVSEAVAERRARWKELGRKYREEYRARLRGQRVSQSISRESLFTRSHPTTEEDLANANAILKLLGGEDLDYDELLEEIAEAILGCQCKTPD